MSPRIVIISNKMQRYTVYLYLETTLHVSSGTSTHHQERAGVSHPQHTQIGSNSSTIASDSSNGVVKNTRCCRYSCMLLMMSGCRSKHVE
jgi:hypothetical protein